MLKQISNDSRTQITAYSVWHDLETVILEQVSQYISQWTENLKHDESIAC